MSGYPWNTVSLLTPGMKNLGNQINAAWPNRARTSDGAVGDYTHTQERSGHNPDDTSANNAEWDGDSDNTPEVRAIDVDVDLEGNGSASRSERNAIDQALVDHIRSLPGISSVLRYIIYAQRIYSSQQSPPWSGAAYSGASQHYEHIHFSGAYSNAADANTSFDYKLEELTMDETSIALKVWAIGWGGETAGDRLARLVAIQSQTTALTTSITALTATLGQVLTNVKGDDGDLAAIMQRFQDELDAATAAHAETLASIGDVDDAVFNRLGDPAVPAETQAAAIRDLLGSPERVADVKALL